MRFTIHLVTASRLECHPGIYIGVAYPAGGELKNVLSLGKEPFDYKKNLEGRPN